jgi:PAS domain S-box-containing protein
MEIRIPSDRLAEANELLKKSAAGELIDNFETVRVRKDGSRLDVSITVSPIRDEAGLIVGSSKTFRDITEAKRNEAQLNRERRLLDAILETVIDGILTIDGILVTDEAGTILKANQSALNQFGFSIDELIGMNVGSLVPALVQETPDFNLQASQGNWFADLIGPVRETVGCRKDGAEWPLEISVGVSLLDDAKIFTAVIRDITERKAAQNLLLEARKEAEQSSLAKSDFLSHMSHELRTPLNAVLGYAQLMQMESEDANTLDSAKSIIKAGRHLLTLINEVLDLARIQSGSFGISLEPVSLHELIRECLEFVRPIASDKGIIIEVDARHAEHLYAMADKQRIRQAVLNLLSNAIKYNRQNGRINVRILSSNAYCRIQVSDTGPGISLENRAKLFVPFERLGEHSVEGTGLGLSLSQNLVKHMGGTLQLLDTSEAGSTFEIQLHVAPSLLSPDDSVPALDESSVGLADEPLLILYIEDNLSNIQLMERALKSVQGAELIVATRAQMGIELALTRIPDLVLLDVHLPDGNGAEVLRKLKAEPKSAHIPIVVVSADATDKQIERLIQAGAKTYLTKPLELNALYAEINDVKMKKAEARVV